MPLIILGLMIFIISLLTGSEPVFLISLVNILSAGGDVTIALMLLKYINKKGKGQKAFIRKRVFQPLII